MTPFQNSSLAWPESYLFFHCAYPMMLFAFRPTDDIKYPGDHTKFFLSKHAPCPLILPMPSLTEYLGAMIMVAWIWSSCLPISKLSIRASPSISSEKLYLDTLSGQDSGISGDIFLSIQYGILFDILNVPLLWFSLIPRLLKYCWPFTRGMAVQLCFRKRK